jgi:hypothetical protein
MHSFTPNATHAKQRGRTYVFTKKEFASFNNEMVSTLKRTAVLAAQQRIDAARICWDSFHDLNKDQYVISWFTSAMGPKLPSESLIKSGEQAYEALKTAVHSGERSKINSVNAIQSTKPIQR